MGILNPTVCVLASTSTLVSSLLSVPFPSLPPSLPSVGWKMPELISSPGQCSVFF